MILHLLMKIRFKMEKKYQKKLEEMTYYQLLRHVCGSQKEYVEARRKLDPLLKRIGEHYAKLRS